MSIENRCGEIKATLQKLTDVKVSPTARLVAVLASCGITDTAEVASLVGRSVRMVQVARNELRETHCADAQPIAPDATHCAKPIAQSETHCAPRVHAPAQMELPSEVLPTKKVKKDSPPTPKRPSKELCLEAFEAYNHTALQLAIPQAAKFTPNRQRQISARLNEYGIEGWTQALTNLGKSAFLTGKTDHGFRADLDFVLQAKSFGKLHDGGYSNGKDTKAAAPVKKVHDQFSERAAREYWAKQDGMIQ